jgi:predicted RNA binding protein YcfA (HicA-like mRNA interferase family)
MNGYYEPLCKILRAHGWRFLRSGKGSHEIWCDKHDKRRTTVPHNCQSRHTANGILRDAGIKDRL